MGRLFTTTDLTRPRRLSAIAVAAWFIAAVVAGRAGIFDNPRAPPFALLGFVLVPMLGFGTAYLPHGRSATMSARPAGVHGQSLQM
jgi:hypothetical protein